MPSTPIYLIGELAKKANVNIQTIRYYERIKLFGPDVRKDASKVRYYSENSFKTLKFIKNAQSLGFQLEEIKELLELRKAPVEKCDRAKARAVLKVEELRTKIQSLKSMEKSLVKLINKCESGKGCSILKGMES